MTYVVRPRRRGLNAELVIRTVVAESFTKHLFIRKENNENEQISFAELKRPIHEKARKRNIKFQGPLITAPFRISRLKKKSS